MEMEEQTLLGRVGQWITATRTVVQSREDEETLRKLVTPEGKTLVATRIVLSTLIFLQLPDACVVWSLNLSLSWRSTRRTDALLPSSVKRVLSGTISHDCQFSILSMFNYALCKTKQYIDNNYTVFASYIELEKCSLKLLDEHFLSFSEKPTVFGDGNRGHAEYVV